jgi:hypothetical protein
MHFIYIKFFINNDNKNKKIGIPSIPSVVVVVETHWGIAGTTIQTTNYRMMSFLIFLDYRF